MQYINAFSEVQREMRFAPHKRTAFEVCALKICMPQVPMQMQTHSRIGVAAVAPSVAPSMPTPAEAGLSENTGSQSPAFRKTEESPVQKTKELPSQSRNEKPETSATKQSSGSLENIKSNWATVCRKFPPTFRSYCTNSDVEMVDGMLKIFCNNDSTRQYLFERKEKIAEMIAQFYGLSTPPNITIETRETNVQPAEVKTSTQKEKPTSPEQRQEQEPTQVIPDDWANFGQEIIGGENF
jgi:DNA polymerase III gamma/tau subunit